jgi:transposase
MRYIQGEPRDQMILFPECIDDYITENSSVRVIDAFVASLNMEELKFDNAIPAKTGRLSYSPQDLLKLYIYGYNNSIRSSRKLEIESQRNIEVMWLLGKLTPDFKTIADFRKDNKAALKNVFKMFVALCKEWNLFGSELIAVDGSKFRASNSRKNNYSKNKLEKKIKYIEERIDKYIKELEDNDKIERTELVPTAEEIKSRISELQSRKAVYEDYKEKLEKENISEISKSDPDARQMKVNNNGIEVGYNVQAAVDDKNKLIVEFDVTNSSADQNQLSEIAIKAKKTLGVDSLECLADKGYYNTEELIKCEEENIISYVAKPVSRNSTGVRDFYPDRFKYDSQKNVYICPCNQELKFKRKKDGMDVYSNFDACGNCQMKSQCTTSKKGREICRLDNQDFLDIVDSRTEENKDKYQRRQMVIEHVFGTVKRTMNAGYFLTRRFDSVRGELSLTFLTYNLKRVINIFGVKEILRMLATI